MTTMCQSDAILNFRSKAMLESVVSRIFWVTEKVVGMGQNDSILNFYTCTSNESGTIACNFKDTKVRLMYGSCAAYV